MMDGFGGPLRKKEMERGAVMTAEPVHLCQLSQSGFPYFLLVAKMLLSGRVECEGESRSLELLFFWML